MVIDPTPFLVLGAGVVLGVALLVGGRWGWNRVAKPWVAVRRAGARAAAAVPRDEQRVVLQTVIERIRSVGKLVALEVEARDIVTATSGRTLFPPLLTPARMAVVLHLRRQYSVDLAGAVVDDAGPEPLAHSAGQPPRCRVIVTLPAVTAETASLDVKPYDLRPGRVLGMLDVTPITADRQSALLDEAREQAEGVFRANRPEHETRARASAADQVVRLLSACGVSAEIRWADAPEASPAPAATQPNAEAVGGRLGELASAMGT